MYAKRILVPVDLESGDADALRFIENLSRDVPVNATLLNVVNLNIFGLEPRVLNELRHENEQRLQALAKLFFEDRPLPRLRVRLGKPYEEILAEAEAEHSELIVMAPPRASRRKWRLIPTTVERIVRDAPCPTLVLPRVWRIIPGQYRETTRPAPATACYPDLERAGV